MKLNTIVTVIALTAFTGLTACTTEKVVDNTVDASLFVGKTAVKTTVGVGKLAVKGTNSAYKAVTK